MSKRDDSLLLDDIKESLIRILEYTEGLSFKEFSEDQKTIDAVIRNFEVIGEASKRVSNEMRQVKPEIPWNSLSDFRNRLIHEYFGVDLEIVWEIIQSNISSLKDSLD
jgi:uncharacterized protein with HEPN domain